MLIAFAGGTDLMLGANCCGQRTAPRLAGGLSLGPSSEVVMSRLAPNSYACPDSNRGFQTKPYRCLSGAVGDVQDVVRTELQVGSFVLHDLLHIGGNLFPLRSTGGA